MDFGFSSGNTALDFVGTMGRWDSDPVDLLDSPGRLREWLVAGGVVDTTPPVRPDDLERARHLRAALHGLIRAALDGSRPSPRDRAAVNAAAAAEPVVPALQTDGELTRRGDITATMSTVARSALELLGGPERNAVRECEAPHCTRLYVDRSARRSRRWCDMRVCGNRAKARAHRQRHGARSE